MDPFTEDDLRQMVLRLAHEIRNPLATIKTSIQLVEHLTQPHGEIAEYFTSVLEEVTRIDQTVRELQAFARLRPGTPMQTPVEELAQLARKAACPQAEAAGVELVVRPGTEVVVRVDRDQITLALDQLIANALRFAPRGSQVTLGWECADHRVRLDVDDAGPGVAPKLADRILRPFFSTSTQATGLGLNIVQKVAHLAAGHLEWRNLEAGGCRFTLVLPEAPREESSD